MSAWEGAAHKQSKSSQVLKQCLRVSEHCCRVRSLDVPMAAELLGKLIGLALAEGALPAGRLQELYGRCETAEYRRDFVAIALKYAKARPVPAFAVGRGAGPHVTDLLLSFCKTLLYFRDRWHSAIIN